MFMAVPARLTGAGAQIHSRHRLRLTAACTAVLAIGLLGGCAAGSAPVAGPDPSDPNVRVRPVGYRSTLGPYTSQRPVSPVPWQEQNQRVAPRDSQSEPAQ
jgi:hypothetical protein